MLSLASVEHQMLELIQRQPHGTSSSESSQMLSVAHGLQLPLVAQKNSRKPKLVAKVKKRRKLLQLKRPLNRLLLKVVYPKPMPRKLQRRLKRLQKKQRSKSA